MGGHDPYSSSKGAAELVTTAYRRSFFSDARRATARLRARRQRDRRRRLGRGPAHPRHHARRARRRDACASATPTRSVPGSTCSTRSAAISCSRRRCGTRPSTRTRLELRPGRARTPARSAGSCERMAELWPGGLALDARRRPAPARGALPQARLLARARAPRLASADGSRRDAAEHRRVVPRAARGRGHARGHPGADRDLRVRCRLVMSHTACRFCGAPVEAVFADLGMSPLANSYLPPERANAWSRSTRCARSSARSASSCSSRSSRRPRQIFSDYAYFSSYSSSWLEHSRRYAEQMIERLGLGRDEPRRGDRLQRRLPAAVLPRAPDPRARHRAGRQRREGGAAEGHPDARGVLRRARPPARSRASPPPTCCSATTCSRTSPTSTTSSPA